MLLASAYTKTTGSWAVGSGNGGLDTGTITNSTWYHVFLMQRPDTEVVDISEIYHGHGLHDGQQYPGRLYAFSAHRLHED